MVRIIGVPRECLIYSTAEEDKRAEKRFPAREGFQPSYEETRLTGSAVSPGLRPGLYRKP